MFHHDQTLSSIIDHTLLDLHILYLNSTPVYFIFSKCWTRLHGLFLQLLPTDGAGHVSVGDLANSLQLSAATAARPWKICKFTYIHDVHVRDTSPDPLKNPVQRITDSCTNIFFGLI